MSTQNCLYSPNVPGVLEGIPGHMNLNDVKGLCQPPQNEVGKELRVLFDTIPNGDVIVKKDSEYGNLYIMRLDATYAHGREMMRFIQWNAKTDVLRISIIIPDAADPVQLRAVKSVESNPMKLNLIQVLAAKSADTAPVTLKSYLEGRGSGQFKPDTWFRRSKEQVLIELMNLQATIPNLRQQLVNSEARVKALTYG